jgi:hypothetical protein
MVAGAALSMHGDISGPVMNVLRAHGRLQIGPLDREIVGDIAT